jgi:hypothetical protein
VESQTDTPSYIAEGKRAYAIEQSAAEEQWAVCWATRWTAIWERAQVVLRSQLSNIDTCESLPELLIEIDNKDNERNLGEEADINYDDL